MRRSLATKPGFVNLEASVDDGAPKIVAMITY